MDTPPATTSASKNILTPCRRIGLSRPSSGCLKKVGLASPVDSSGIHPTVAGQKSNRNFKNENRCPSILKDYNNINKSLAQKIKRRLIHSPHNLSVELVQTNSQPSQVKDCQNENSIPPTIPTLGDDDDIGNQKCKTQRLFSDDDRHTSVTSHLVSSDVMLRANLSSINSSEMNAEIIEGLALQVINKKKRLEELKVQNLYMKKHNLVELRELTSKWRSAGQDALRYSLKLANQAGYSVTLKQLMSQHGFNPELMGYDSGDDEFS